MTSDREVVETLTRVLVRACRALAEAGQPQRAGRLAADAWVAVRPTHTRQAQHLDGAMHHIARLEQQREQPPATSPEPAGPARKESAMATAPTEDPVLDVRSEEPRRRHELIFEEFTELPVGQAYVLVNDHDPKPLRYQFEAENAGEFSWQYLEEGPQVWRVRIGRTAAPAGAVGEVDSPASGTPAARAEVLWPDWRTVVAARDTGPQVAVLHESAELKVVLVALDAGQRLPDHPGPAASFHILSGTGAVVIDEVEHPVSAGATVVAASGTRRAVGATSPLVFLGNLGDPASEDGPH